MTIGRLTVTAAAERDTVRLSGKRGGRAPKPGARHATIGAGTAKGPTPSFTIAGA